MTVVPAIFRIGIFVLFEFSYVNYFHRMTLFDYLVLLYFICYRDKNCSLITVELVYYMQIV